MTVVLRCDAKYEPAFQYVCSNGHDIGADAPVDACPVYRLGERCDGELTRFGKGSRSKENSDADRDA